MVTEEKKVVDYQSHSEDDKWAFKHFPHKLVDELTFCSTLDMNGGLLGESPVWPFCQTPPPPHVDLPHLASSFAPVIITSTTRGHCRLTT